VRSRRPKAEEILIHLMLKDGALAQSLLGELRPQDFTDPLYQRAAERMFEVLGQDGSLEPSCLFRDGDEELNSLFSHYAVLELDCEDPQKSFRDCVSLIRQQDPEKKMKQIVRALKEAEQQGNDGEYKRLLELQQELCRRPGRRIPGM
jgi:hypothetical protein